MKGDRIPLFDPDALVDTEEYATRLVLEGIPLVWGQLLEAEGWYGLARSLKADTGHHYTTHAYQVAVRTMLLGLKGHRERTTVKWPATWAQLLKQDTLAWLDRWPRWLWCVAYRLRRWLGPVRMDQVVVEVQTYKSACPHINAGPQHNPQHCISYLHRLDWRGYDEVDYLVSYAYSILAKALEPVTAPDQPFDAFRQAQGLDTAARRVLELLAEAAEAMDNE